MNSANYGPIVRRWGFYANNRLAYAGVAYQSGPLELQLRVFETEQHSHTATLPERIQLEQLIRDHVSSDVERVLGLGWIAVFHFESLRQSDHRLAQAVFNTSATKPLSDK